LGSIWSARFDGGQTQFLAWAASISGSWAVEVTSGAIATASRAVFCAVVRCLVAVGLEINGREGLASVSNVGAIWVGQATLGALVAHSLVGRTASGGRARIASASCAVGCYALLVTSLVNGDARSAVEVAEIRWVGAIAANRDVRLARE